MSATQLVLGITGHRPQRLGGYRIPNPIYDQVIYGLNAAFDKFKPEFVITGMAQGTDQWAAEICVQRGIKFIAAVPFRGQEAVWPPASKAQYHKLLALAHLVQVISESGYSKQAMSMRNDWLVRSSDQIVAVWDGSDEGGTAEAIGMAFQYKKPVELVPLAIAPMAVGELYKKLAEAHLVTSTASPAGPGTKRIVDV